MIFVMVFMIKDKIDLLTFLYIQVPKQKMSSSQSTINSSGMRSTRSNSEPSKSDNKHSNVNISGSKDTGVIHTGSGIHGGLRKGRDSNGKLVGKLFRVSLVFFKNVLEVSFFFFFSGFILI